MKRLLFAAWMLCFGAAFACAESGSGLEFSKTAAASTFTWRIDVGAFDEFSTQVNYSSIRPATATISDGNYSSATLTVANYLGLDGRASTATITLQDGKNTSAIDGAIIRINGRRYTEGTDWFRLATSTMTMNSLKSAIDAYWEYNATVSSNVVTVQDVSTNSVHNNWTITTTTGVLQLSGSTFGGGRDFGYFTLNGITLTEGTHWNAETSTTVTAQNIRDAINDSASLDGITAVIQSSGIVRVALDVTGVYLYPLSVSDTSYLTPSYPELTGGEASDISVANDTFYEPSHGYSVGLPMVFLKSAGTAPGGLTAGTTYYAIPTTDNLFKIATSKANAQNAVAVDVTGLTGGGTFTFGPLAFAAGPASWNWQSSNDGTNFIDISGATTTYSADGSMVYDGVSYPYRYIRFNFVPPTTGGISLDCYLNWRK